MKRIEGRAKTVRELLHGARFAIDFYQREYAWQERQVRELVDDLTGKFLDFHDPSHEHAAVEDYGHYFLGPVVVSHKQDRKFVVDGQQRLTTLTLFLIFLHHLQQDIDGASDVIPLIHSTKFGRKSFNLDVPERNDMMHALLDGRMGAKKHGQYWNYTSLESSTRVALYIDGGTAEENKAVFDRLHADREVVESEFGGPLHWQRLDDKMACRISHEVEGGWGDESTWPTAIDQAVDAMGRLYAALGPRVEAGRGM